MIKCKKYNIILEDNNNINVEIHVNIYGSDCIAHIIFNKYNSWGIDSSKFDYIMDNILLYLLEEKVVQQSNNKFTLTRESIIDAI